MDEHEQVAGPLADRVIKTARTRYLVAQTYVVIPESRIELELRKILPRYVDGAAGVASALGSTGAIGAALLTSDFKAFASISGTSWQAVFVVALVLSALWLLRAIVRWKKGAGVADVVAAIVNSGSEVDATSDFTPSADARPGASEG